MMDLNYINSIDFQVFIILIHPIIILLKFTSVIEFKKLIIFCIQIAEKQEQSKRKCL